MLFLKIGIVGRTGAGKTTLALSLLRILEASAGRILIDGVDIAKVGLHDLRSMITVIPQDPVFFEGTIRYNLDPFHQHTDPELWLVLEQSHLKAFIEATPGGLDFDCGEAGRTLR